MIVANSVLIIFVTALGFGAWLPLLSIGGRLFIGMAAIPIVLYVLHFLFGLELSTAAWLTFALAILGLIRAVWSWKRVNISFGALINPAIVLPTLFTAYLAIRGYGNYFVYLGDEFGSWLYWTKEAFVTNSMTVEGMRWRQLQYTQGWPLALLYPQLFHEEFDLARSLPVGFLWHATLLGIFYDLASTYITQNTKLSAHVSTAVSWVLILLFLAAEATWTLLPQHFLIEKPQLFMIAAVFGFLTMSLLNTEEQGVYTLAAGITLAAGYLTKVTVLGVVPAVLLVVLSPSYRGVSHRWPKGWVGWQEVLLLLCRLLGPIAVIYLSWRLIFPLRPSCLADPFSIQLPANQSDHLAYAAQVAGNMLSAIGTYLAIYKFPLTILGLIGLIAGLRLPRLAPIVFALVIYDLFYVGALHPLYAYCFDIITRTKFDSLERYIRVPLRLTHLFGLLFLAFWFVHAINRFAPIILEVGQSKLMLPLLLICCLIAATYQATEIEKALANTETRWREPRAAMDHLNMHNREIAAFNKLIPRLNIEAPRVSFIAQFSVGDEFLPVFYNAIPDRRSLTRKRYRLESSYSWGPKRENYRMKKTTTADLRQHILKSDIIWPFLIDSWITPVLQSLPGTRACSLNPTQYFYVKHVQDKGKFSCIKKFP